jgi:predicted Fe-Mo cluster-binding NifX family protein
MKIAFPLLNRNELAIDFVHSQYLGIFDDENNQTDILSFKGHEKNTGIVAFFDVITSAGLDSVISPYYSFMALRVFKENNIETYKAKGTSLQENINLYITNELKSFDVYESVITSPCSKNCNTCGPVCKVD